MIKYVDSLEVNEAEPIINYILSFSNAKEKMDEDKLRRFNGYITDILEKNGIIEISKDTGISIAKKPNK